MRRILCFGDSLTWGFDPESRVRFEEDSRWPCVMQEALGDGYKVIEEGQNGRTIATDDPTKGFKNGLTYVIPCVESHKPLDLMIIMLGSNDLKSKFRYTAGDIADEMKLMIESILAYNRFRMEDKMKILLIAPPCITSTITGSRFADKFDASAAVTARNIAPCYKALADSYGIMFMDASEYVEVSREDSLHLDREGQIKLGESVYKFLTDKDLL